MSVILISYANEEFFKSQKLLKKSALKNGVDEVIMFNDIWLKKQSSFYTTNKKLLDNKKGAGYWIWKPYIILESLKKIKEDDVLIYLDSGTEIIDNIKPLVEIAKKQSPLLFYNNGHKNSTWTKRDCFYFMNCEDDLFYNGNQVAACYMFLTKNSFTLSFIAEWLNFVTDEKIISDNPNVCGLQNFSNFRDHRHDQSVLSLLATKYHGV